jgi:hypothetical protein
MLHPEGKWEIRVFPGWVWRVLGAVAVVFGCAPPFARACRRVTPLVRDRRRGSRAAMRVPGVDRTITPIR